MCRYDAISNLFTKVSVVNRARQFANRRIAGETLPQGYYLYDVWHDDMYRYPLEFVRRMMGNFWGLITSNIPIGLEKSKCVYHVCCDLGRRQTDLVRISDTCCLTLYPQESSRVQNRRTSDT